MLPLVVDDRYRTGYDDQDRVLWWSMWLSTADRRVDKRPRNVDTGAEINFIHPDVASAFNIELANFAGVFEKPLSFDATVLKGDYEQSIITNNLSFPCRMGCVYPMALLMLKIFTKELMTTLATFT
ncbi:uncharacterized protein SAPINGB_P003176 [Magnusiomyces paraingens]|uniref:Uncharacterized protein n=1 Tax=Magnusiomyces paraingens TaxID=2606893 RepID=A0A5E8BPR8_9ASCO|nr:uncharacterized protein SAPINGB_P003176 [Saprochaete ingens]VVT51678.1 unnamed protein product [Saprochaete ingens]